MVICYIIISALMIMDTSGNISNLSHFAGFLAGYAAMKIVAAKDILWDPLKSKKLSQAKEAFRTTEPRQERKSYEDNDGPVSNAELDALLDKISQNGINSLSEYELARLRRAREEMRGK